MKKMRKPSSKYSLVFATLVAFSCVCTAGVSTFAWFQASSAVTIHTTGDTAEISVSAPPNIIIGTPNLYKYNGNFYSSNEENISFSEGEGDTQFTAISGGSVSTTNNMYPGQKATYCIVVSATGREINGGSLTLGADTSFSTTKPGSNHFYKLTGSEGSLSNSGNDLNFTEAIKLSGAVATSSSTVYNDDAEDEGNAPANNLELCSTKNITATTLYFYFTVLFSNDDSTYYQEYTDTPYTKTYSKRPLSGNRFFYKTKTGNSNCYEGWTFTITKLTVSVF